MPCRARERRTLRALATVALVAAALVALPAAAAPQADQDRTDSLRVFLLTFGKGEAVWERFGHNALWVHDPGAGTDRAYHYGLFDMSRAGFMVDFLQGRMFYSMGEVDALRLIDAYRRMGRPATIQSLNLSREQIRELQEFLEWNMRPENRGYRYDYFRDNCSTRVRDALDRTLGGQLSAALRGRGTNMTYRSEALRLTADDPLLTLGLDVGLGPLADQRLDRWQLAFIPMRLRDDVRTITVLRDGRSVPLVTGERHLDARGVPDGQIEVSGEATGGRLGWMLALGLACALLFAALGWGATRPGADRLGATIARWTLGLAGAAWGLLAGGIGVILAGLWLFTDHQFAHANENLFQANPLALGLAVLVPLALTGRAIRPAARLAAALAALSLTGLLVYPLPLTHQATLGIILLALPIHLALAWTLARLRHVSSGTR